MIMMGKWINFKDRLPPNEVFTVQRRTPETPKKDYSFGCFYYDPKNVGFAEYRKTAQWQLDD